MSVNETNIVFLSVNLFCFVVYTVLAVKLHFSLRGIVIDKRTKIVTIVFALALLVKTIIWLINILSTAKINKWVSLADEVMRLMILILLFLFIFDMVSVRILYTTALSIENFNK